MMSPVSRKRDQITYRRVRSLVNDAFDAWNWHASRYDEDEVGYRGYIEVSRQQVMDYISFLFQEDKKKKKTK